MTELENPLRLMAILAHPDDELFGNSPAFARYAAEGVSVEITLVTATRRQRGSFGAPEVCPGPEALGRMRESELRAAGATRGAREAVVLDYLDGKLEQAEPDQIICELVTHIRRVRPQVVITWGPAGGFEHPDHIAIGQFATTAVMHAADPRYGYTCGSRRAHAVSKLYYMALEAEQAAAYISAFGDIDDIVVDGDERRLVVTPDWLTTRIDVGEHWRRGWQAITCHGRQLPNYERLAAMPEEQQRLLWGRDCYYRALTTVNGGRALETDLFEGLREPAADRAVAA